MSALLEAEKFKLFLERTEHLGEKDKTFSVCIKESQVYERLGNYKYAIQSARVAISISQTSPYAWQMLLHASRLRGLGQDDLKNIALEIPNEIFERYHESKIGLINEIALHVDAHISERVLVDWFVQNPNQVATPLTQIHTNTLLVRSEVGDNPYIPSNCGDGITYNDGFNTFTKILVRNLDIKHPDLLDINSPMGALLENAKEGEKVDGIEILERLSPYVAAFRLAASLRSISNDGTDAFRQFTLPSNSSEWIPYFENILRRYSSGGKPLDNAINNPKLPLLIRGKYTNKYDPIQGALSHLTSQSPAQYIGLFCNGEESPNKVVIDIYTAVYLSLMGFSANLGKLGIEVVLTQYTAKAIEAWLKSVLRDDYMSMGLSDGGLYKITDEDVRNDKSGLVEGLQSILEYANVETLKPADTPETLVRIKDMLDETVYSAFQLSYANNVPLLCIDNMLCGLLYRSGCPTANMNIMVSKLLKSLTIHERTKSIRLNLLADTPVPIFYSDIVELSKSYEYSDVFLVLKFLEKYEETIGTADSPSLFLSDIARNVTAIAYVDGGIWESLSSGNPKYDGYAEHIFNICCRLALKVGVNGTAEQKLAAHIFSVMYTPRRIPQYLKLISLLSSNFATGHFLDIDACNDALVSLQRKLSR